MIRPAARARPVGWGRPWTTSARPQASAGRRSRRCSADAARPRRRRGWAVPQGPTTGGTGRGVRQRPNNRLAIRQPETTDPQRHRAE